MRTQLEQFNHARSEAERKGNPLVLWPEDLNLPKWMLNNMLPVLLEGDVSSGWRETIRYSANEQPEYRANYAYARYVGGDIVEYVKA